MSPKNEDRWDAIKHWWIRILESQKIWQVETGLIDRSVIEYRFDFWVKGDIDVEADSDFHNYDDDEERDGRLAMDGIKVIRFSDGEVRKALVYLKMGLPLDPEIADKLRTIKEAQEKPD